MIGSEKRNRQLGFELQNSHVCEKRSKPQISLTYFPLNPLSPESDQIQFSSNNYNR